MKSVTIHGRQISPSSTSGVKLLFELFKENGVQVCISKLFADSNRELTSSYKLDVYEIGQTTSDAFISLGGDGTFLETLTHVGKSETPIMGINMGRLGFLASTAEDQINEAVNHLVSGNYEIDSRSLVYLNSSEDVFGDQNFALNEFSILRKETSTMITVGCYLDGVFLNSYWADGIMVSTPTGSTGYSLSCGGPILLPENENFVITPVSPHNLNIRPLIVPDKAKLTFEVESRNASFLISLDSRSHTVNESIQLELERAPFNAQLIKVKGNNFIETLRNKLSWGLDRRN